MEQKNTTGQAAGAEKKTRKTYKRGATTFYTVQPLDVGVTSVNVLGGPFTKITDAMDADHLAGDFDVVSVRYRGTRAVKTVTETKKRK